METMNQTMQIEHNGFIDKLELFEYKSRINRKKYLGLFTIWCTVVSLCEVAFIYSMVIALSLFHVIIVLSLAPLMIISAVHMIFLQIRRLKDFNISPWWALLNIIPPIALVLIIIIAFIPGTSGENNYGSQSEKESSFYSWAIVSFFIFLLPLQIFLSMID